MGRPEWADLHPTVIRFFTTPLRFFWLIERGFLLFSFACGLLLLIRKVVESQRQSCSFQCCFKVPTTNTTSSHTALWTKLPLRLPAPPPHHHHRHHHQSPPSSTSTFSSKSSSSPWFIIINSHHQKSHHRARTMSTCEHRARRMSPMRMMRRTRTEMIAMKIQTRGVTWNQETYDIWIGNKYQWSIQRNKLKLNGTLFMGSWKSPSLVEKMKLFKDKVCVNAKKGWMFILATALVCLWSDLPIWMPDFGKVLLKFAPHSEDGFR